MTKKYVCGFNENGTFLAGCVYKDENSLTRPKMLNRAVVLTEVVEQEAFDLYNQGYYRNAKGVPTSPELQFTIGQIFEGQAPTEAYTWSESHNALIEEVECGAGCVRRYQIVAIPEPTAEELEAQALADAKRERAEAVSKITVEVDGLIFDGDETAQTRMGRTIAAAIALGVDLTSYKQVWVLADNTVAEVTVSQLAQALKLAGEAQTALWTVPYSAEA